MRYAWCYRRARNDEQPVQPAQAGCFGVGIALWALATLSAIGAYAYDLFWMRALQVLLLVYVAPFFLALGKPVTVVRHALGPASRERIDRLLTTRLARVLFHPLTTSLAMLATPWLLYLTPWYSAALQSEWVGAPTRILLVAIGFGYFYARLQADPVPRRYSQLISLLISVAEALGDGVLGLVIWQGSLIAPAYYEALHRVWGPYQRLGSDDRGRCPMDPRRRGRAAVCACVDACAIPRREGACDRSGRRVGHRGSGRQ